MRESRTELERAAVAREPGQRLGTGDTGRWLVTTARGTRHVWDLDAMTYQRLPAAAASFRLPLDGPVVPITRVDEWPQVGSRFLLWFDEPSMPDRLEHWRISNRIVSIEPLPPPLVS